MLTLKKEKESYKLLKKSIYLSKLSFVEAIQIALVLGRIKIDVVRLTKFQNLNV